MGDQSVDTSWASKANCKKKGPTIFYPERDEPSLHRMVREAKAICALCTVQAECLDYALRNEAIGIWGGKTDQERRRIRSQLGIQMNVNGLTTAVRAHQK